MLSKNIVLSCVLWMSSVGIAMAQEFEAFYQNYFAHPYIMNVARAGANGAPEIIMDYNRSFAEFENSPTLANIFYNGAVTDNIGLGAQIGSHQAGYQNTFRAQLNYSYNIQLEEVKVYFGLGTAYNARSLSSRAFNNPNIVEDDPVLAELADGLAFFDVSLGTHVVWDKWAFGLAFPNALRARLDKEESIQGEDAGSFDFVTAYAEYDLRLEDLNFSLKPSIYYKAGENYLRSTDGSVSSVDLNLLMSLDEDNLYGGLSYRYAPQENGATTILLGARLGGVQAFYTYRIGFSQFQRYNLGSHELSCKIQLKK